MRYLTTQHSAKNGVNYSQLTESTYLSKGDSLTLNFDFQGTETAYKSNSGNYFTFGLLGSTTSTFSIADTFGYGISTRLEEDSRSATTAPIAQVMNGTVRGTTTFTANGSDSVGTAFSTNGTNRTDHLSFSFSITRMADDGLLLKTVFTNVTDNVSFVRTYSVAADALQNKDDDPYTFDAVFIGYYRAGSDNGTIFDIDNVTVTYTSAIPEPATVALLLGFGGLLGVFVWRRARR